MNPFLTACRITHRNSNIDEMIALPIQSMASSPNSIRVEFETIRSSSGPFATVGFKIERRMPPSLQNYFSVMTFDDFCNQIDDAFFPFNKARNLSNILSLFSFLIFVILIIIQVLFFVGIIGGYSSSSSSGISSFRFIPIFFIIAFVLVLVIQCSRVCWITRHWNATVGKINSICTDFSIRYSNLQIRFRNSEYMMMASSSNRSPVPIPFAAFIEFEPSSSNHTAVDTPISYATVAYPTTTTGNTNKTIAQRMADLESIRSLISDYEYQQKRNEILSQV